MGVLILNNEQLLTEIKNGYTPEYHFFWGGPFSQWAYSPFVADGVRYVTAEHYMMYQKAALFNDTESMNAILKTSDPSIAKKIGRNVKNYDDKSWDSVRFNVVVRGSYLKFTATDEAKGVLLSTGDVVFVEASPYDKIWGIGMSETDPKRFDPKQWKGENLLGYALNYARDIIRVEASYV